MKNEIDISGIDKALILVCLYNEALTMNFARYGAIGRRPELTYDEAKMVLADARDGRIDYLRELPMKVDLSGETLWPALFDRDNGAGAALRAVEHARALND